MNNPETGQPVLTEEQKMAILNALCQQVAQRGCGVVEDLAAQLIHAARMINAA